MDPFYLALLLYLAAIVLAFVDLFVPSGGVLAILAVLSATASVLFGFRSGQLMGMSMLTLVVASIPVFAILAINIWPRTPIGRRVILRAPEARPATHPSQDKRQELIGVVVQSEYALMPSGQIRIDGKRYNATTKDEIIEAGQNVEVIDVKERNLVVRSTDAAPTGKRTQSNSTETIEPANSDNLLDLPADEIGLDSID